MQQPGQWDRHLPVCQVQVALTGTKGRQDLMWDPQAAASIAWALDHADSRAQGWASHFCA